MSGAPRTPLITWRYLSVRRARWAALRSVDGAEVEPVGGLDEAHRARAGAHDQGVGARPAPEEAHASQELSVGHARGREHDVAGAGQLPDVVDALHVLDAAPPGT